MRLALFTILAAIAPACAKTISVRVGRDARNNIANVYTPNAVQAEVGDIVRFEFRGGNHTITQSSFAEPCTQQFNTVTQRLGADSGFVPFINTSNTIGTFSIQVRQTSSPIWMFCHRAPHCNVGMVFSINAPTDPTKNTMAKFIEKARTAAHPGPGVTAPFTPPPAPPPSTTTSTLATTTPTPTSTTSVEPTTTAEPISNEPIVPVAPGEPVPSQSVTPRPSGAVRRLAAPGILFTAAAVVFAFAL